MNFETIVMKRRSIRSYTDQDVPDEMIQKLLAYGHTAPTAGNLHPWEFIVVRDAENRQAMVDTTFRGNDETGSAHQDWLMQAPVLVAVLVNKAKSAARYGENALKTLVYLDGSACIENMLLGAVSLGLDSCYISGFREDELRKALGVPETREVIAFLPIGYGAEDGKARPKTALEDLVYYETFGA
jgi:nitroreductase